MNDNFHNEFKEEIYYYLTGEHHIVVFIVLNNYHPKNRHSSYFSLHCYHRTNLMSDQALSLLLPINKMS